MKSLIKSENHLVFYDLNCMQNITNTFLNSMGEGILKNEEEKTCAYLHNGGDFCSNFGGLF